MLVVLIEVAFIRLPSPNWKDKEWKKEVREQICDFLCIWILAWPMLPLRAIEPPFPCWLSASWSTRKVRRYFFNHRIFLLTFPGSNLLFWLILRLVRRGICIFSWAGRKAVYGLDVAMFVSLIVTWWRCQSTSTRGNLIAPATWRTSSQLEYMQIRNQEIPEAGLRASLSNVYFLVWIWIDDKPNATFFCQKNIELSAQLVYVSLN